MMPRYMLSVHTGTQDPRQPMTSEERQRGFEKVAEVEAAMNASHALVFSGRLDQPDSARVVRPAKGHVRWTDGPYAETKEVLGGFYIVDAADIDAAGEWASKVTLAIDTPIELRAFADFSEAAR
jgi:hypothetical protein